MLQIPGYELHEKFFETCGYIFFRGIELSTGKQVIVKTPMPENESYRFYVYLQHEYLLLKEISSPGIIRVLNIVESDDRVSLILEPFEGTLLSELISNSGLTVADTLVIAKNIAFTLGELHRNGIITGTLDPSRIIADPANGTIKMPDFTRSVMLPPGEKEISAANFHYPGPLYIAPEQTGCINRLVDYRTDFYLLGLLLYEMLTGKTPFHGDDLTGLIHSHISKKPVPPSNIKKNLPASVSMVVMKLLEKNAENRYQSSWGIRSDLEKCIEHAASGKVVHEFHAGQNDRSETLMMPVKLYGRERETSVLTELFKNAASGKSCMVIVSGDPGSGKTSLAQELKKHVLQYGGYFIEGTFNRQPESPYSAFINAFSDFARLIITEKKEKFEKWRDKIRGSIGTNGKIITELFPSLELITGKFPDIPELGPGETGNRFRIVLQNFFKSISSREYPLALFLDDLQFADDESLKLLETVMSGTESSHLMIICSMDKASIDDSPRIRSWMETICNIGIKLHTLNLKPLNDGTVNLMMQDMLHTQPEKTREISRIIAEKTLGNPGHINRFIKKIRSGGIFTLDSITGEWIWKNEKVRELDAEDDIISIYAEQISEIDDKTSHTLSVASCIGMTFTPEILSAIAGLSLRETAVILSSAINKRFIVPVSSQYDSESTVADKESPRYRFIHPRIRETFYSLPDMKFREKLHLAIAAHLIENTPGALRNERIIEITNQMNNGIGQISLPEKLVELASLNLETALKVKATGAYNQAVNYLKTAVSILPENCWKENYSLTFSIYRELSECKYLSGDSSKAEDLFNYIIERAQSSLDIGEINNIRIILYANSGKFYENNRTCYETLKLFGLEIADPDDPEKIETAITEEMAIYKKQMAGRQISELESLPETPLPDKRLCLKLIMNMLSSAYVSNPPLLGAAVLKGLNISLEYGASPSTTFMFSTCGLFLASRYKDYKSAYEFGLLAFKFNERFHHPATSSNVPFVFGNFINPWRGDIRDSVSYLRSGLEEGIINGDFIYGSFCATSIPRYLLSIGSEPLHAVLDEIEKTLSFFKRIKNFASLERQKLAKHAVLNLMGRLPDPVLLSSDDFDETSHIIQMNEIHYGTGIALYYYYKLFTLFLGEFYKEALGMAIEGIKNIRFVFASIQESEMIFYYSLCLTRMFNNQNENEQKSSLEILNKNLEMLEYWYTNSPGNFSSRYFLVKAELCAISGNHISAAELYDKAINESAANGFTLIQALCCEIASQYHSEMGHEYISESLLDDALNLYTQWGCDVKINSIRSRRTSSMQSLEHRQKKQLSHREGTPSAAGDDEDFRKPADLIDFISVVRASQAISGEIVLSSLIDRLMKVVIESSGAENGILFIENENLGNITARAVSDGESIRVLRDNTEIDESLYPVSVINYVKRTWETVLLGDATVSPLFSGDRYIIDNRAGSILCIPVRHKTGMSVILYLENRLSTEVFNPSRMDVIYLLCSQIAISIENALNFEETNRIKESLRESEENYRILFENIQDVFYRSDTRGNVLLTSPSIFRVFGYKPEEITGVNIADIFYYNPEERQKLVEILDREGFVEDYEIALKKKDGTVINVSTNSHFYYNKKGQIAGVEGLIRDITARKNAEAQIMAEKERLAVTLRSIGEGVIVTDTNTGIILINRVAEKLTGYTQAEAYGRKLSDVFMIADSRGKNLCDEIMNDLLGSCSIIEIESGLNLTNRMNKNILIALSASPIRDDTGSLTGTAIVFRDITEKQRMEDELLKTQKLESISIFAGGIAHDFNNLLTGILGNVSLCKHNMADKTKIQKRLDEIENASLRAKDLTQQLLTFSRGGTPIKKTTSIVGLVMESAKFVLSGANVKCEYFIDDNVSTIEADEGQMNQVFNNILINARQAMPEGGIINIRIHNEKTSRTDDNSGADDYVCIKIEDHGTGIPKENLQRIFDPFFTTKDKGNGLGLATTYSIIKKHDGSISVMSEPGAGTSFTILLPASENSINNIIPADADGFSGNGKVLIMDDEDIILSVSSEMVELMGYEPVAAKDGNEVVTLYSEALEAGKPFDFVIMDLTIPGGTGGKEAIAKLRALDPGVKAIVSSGYSNDPVMSDYKSYGFSGIIVKPYKMEELRRLLRSMTDEKS